MSETPEILTPRLRLRHWRPADGDRMDEINRDPEVLRFLNRTAPGGMVQRFLNHWREHGFGPWAVEERRPDAALLGFVGPAYPTWLPELAERPELGWRLASRAWGRGYATEAAAAAREYAFARTGLRELIAIIDPGNKRSQRVASKLGGTRERHVHNPLLGHEVEVWSLTPRCGPASGR